jgi:hypothetical protein
MFGGSLKILVCQGTGHRENDFAISIKSAEDPGCCGELCIAVATCAPLKVIMVFSSP